MVADRRIHENALKQLPINLGMLFAKSMGLLETFIFKGSYRLPSLSELAGSRLIFREPPVCAECEIEFFINEIETVFAFRKLSPIVGNPFHKKAPFRCLHFWRFLPPQSRRLKFSLCCFSAPLLPNTRVREWSSYSAGQQV